MRVFETVNRTGPSTTKQTKQTNDSGTVKNSWSFNTHPKMSLVLNRHVAPFGKKKQLNLHRAVMHILRE